MVSLHIAVFLFGLAGLFGKLLNLSAFTIVWGRTFFAVISIILFFLVRKEHFKKISRKDLFLLSSQGMLLSAHWVSFFYSIQISSVAIALLSFSSFPMFVLILEKILYKRPITAVDVTSLLLILTGIFLIIPEFSFTNQSFQGILWGLVAGCTFAILVLLNQKLSRKLSSTEIALGQNFIAAVLLTPVALPVLQHLTRHDWILLVILGVFCTALAHSLFIYSLTKVKAFTASIVTSLEPVYGIITAFFLLNETPLPKEIAGGAIILATAVFISIRSKNSVQNTDLDSN